MSSGKQLFMSLESWSTGINMITSTESKLFTFFQKKSRRFWLHDIHWCQASKQFLSAITQRATSQALHFQGVFDLHFLLAVHILPSIIGGFLAGFSLV